MCVSALERASKYLDKVYKHPRLGEVLLRQRWTTSRISLSVKPSGEVRLSYPRLISTARALRFLEDKIEWIEASRSRMAERSMAGSGYTKAQIEELRRMAKRELPAMVERLAREHNFRYGRVTIRATRSKWGCCTSNNNLSLSLFLMTLPLHLQEFVVLHELCHTVHHNHSAEFHALLNRLTGGRERELERQLKGIRKNLRFRRGVESDIDSVMALVGEAQAWFAERAIDQWQDGYPTRNIIEQDIASGYNYIVEYEGVVVAAASISFDGEVTYSKVYDGEWLNDDIYGVVHRIMVSNAMKRKGVAREILYFVEELCRDYGAENIRIDTHRDNAPMRNMLKKLGYSHCGRIMLTSGAWREAYQKVL